MHKNLREIFYNLGKLSDKWDPYFDVYEVHLAKFINRGPKILEIGVQNGGSLDMWLEYFGEGTKVIGVDKDENCLSLQYNKNVDVIIGDQGHEELWNRVISKYSNFDIIIDDGSHVMSDQIFTIEKLYPHLNLNGVYIVEDTHTSYMESHGGRVNSPNTFLSYAKSLTDYLNKEFIPNGFIKEKTKGIFGNQLNSITFYNSMVIFEKLQNKQFKRVFSHDQL